MRYFSYNEYKTKTGVDDFVETKSEEDIRKEYYLYWYNKMCKKYSKEVVDADYSFENCLEDWVTVNWAWEVK